MSPRGARIVRGLSAWGLAYAVEEDESAELVCANRCGLELDLRVQDFPREKQVVVEGLHAA